MVEIELETIAKYPFLSEAGEYLKEKKFTLEQFGTDPDLQSVITNAYNRILIAVKGEIYKPNVEKKDLDRELFSFLIAVILLKLSGMNVLIRRFSLQEARRAEKNLESDLNTRMPSDDYDYKIWKNKRNYHLELAIQIIKKQFLMNIQKQEDYFLVPVVDYLQSAINFHEQEWKLVNRLVNNGNVFLTSHEAVRLIRNELDNLIKTKIHATTIQDVPESFKKPIADLIQLGNDLTPKFMETTEYPPCIKHAIDVLNKGENLPHSGRFMLATYLLNKGQTIEEIAPLFKNAPDYNEKVTLYQLKHVAGNFGSGTKYACPSCEKLRSENLCFAIPECNNIINPLQFGRKKIPNA